MSAGQQLAAGIVAIALIGVYSIIMVATSGEAASWAWIILLAAFVLLGAVAWSAATARREGRGE